MRRVRAAGLLVAVLAAASGACAGRTKSAPVPPAVLEVILVRHAEAGQDGADPGLTAAGRARAACLSDRLAPNPLTHVFTSTWTRSRETAAPVAAACGVTPQDRDPMQPQVLVKELLALPAGSRALVVGHTNTLPMLAEALGGKLSGLVEERGQPAIPRTEHDRLVVLKYRTGAGEVSERLLAFDESRLACPSAASVTPAP